MILTQTLKKPVGAVVQSLDFLNPAFDLALRFYVAWVFFASGLNKIQNWDSTLALFEYEYHVPLLPPISAAYMGTFTELFFPVLLVFGLGARLSAFVLFVFNIIAVMSYPDLGEVGTRDHMHWGMLIAVILFHGPGRISLDRWLQRKLAD
jgi:putative oxidoreductase